MNKFRTSAIEIPRELRCIQTTPGNCKQPVGHYFLGVPQSDFLGLSATDNIPHDIEGISFLMGERSIDLITDFVDSGYAENIRKLSIGSSSDGGGYNQDYSNIISILNDVSFPNLEVLELGVWERYHASEYMHSFVGNVTAVLSNCPKLEKLGLYGEFEVRSRQNFSNLKLLHMVPYDSIGDKRFSQDTLNNVLESNLVRLEDCLIWSNTEDELDIEYKTKNGLEVFKDIYQLPEKIFEAGSLPNLQKLEIAGDFREGEKQKLLGSHICGREGVIYFLDDMFER